MSAPGRGASGSRLADVTGNRKFVDSPLEGDGFELLVPRQKSRGFPWHSGHSGGIDIHTDTGLSIRQKWQHGPRNYLGLMMAGFPNLFMVTGPQSPGVKSQMILACEQHIDWIADCVHYLYDHGFTRIEAEQDAEDAWVRHNNEVADRTLYPLANSCSLLSLIHI